VPNLGRHPKSRPRRSMGTRTWMSRLGKVKWVRVLAWVRWMEMWALVDNLVSLLNKYVDTQRVMRVHALGKSARHFVWAHHMEWSGSTRSHANRCDGSRWALNMYI
jgi:hypothetical protein